jgi:hypothetical protein
VEPVRPLGTRRGLGGHRAWLVVMACVAWRDVPTPQPVGAFAGLTPPPDQRGQASGEFGMTQAGQGSRRPMAVEMAWGWGRCQPERAVTPGYQARCGRGRARRRTIGMVALARKWRLARWRCLTPGVPPAGALLTGAVAVSDVSQGRCGELARVWAARGGARVRLPNRGGGGVAHPGASQAPRAQAGAGVRGRDADPDRRSLGPGSPTPHDATSTPRRCPIPPHSVEAPGRSSQGTQHKQRDNSGHIEGPPMSRDKRLLCAVF